MSRAKKQRIRSMRKKIAHRRQRANKRLIRAIAASYNKIPGIETMLPEPLFPSLIYTKETN